MINQTILNIFEPHPYKREIEHYKIKQYDLAKSVGITQPALSKMLSGIQPMKEIVEDQIRNILVQVKKSKRKHQKIIKSC